MKRPLVWCSAAFILGSYAMLRYSAVFAAIVIGCIIYTAFAYKKASYFILVAVFFAGMLPIQIYNIKYTRPIEKYDNRNVSLMFEIKDAYKTRSSGGFYRYEIKAVTADNKSFEFSGEIYTPQKYTEGDIVKADAKIYALSRTDPWRFTKINRECHFSCYSKSGKVVGRSIPGLTDKIKSLRKGVIGRLKEKSEPHVFGFLSAILTGNKENLSDYRAETFRKTGLSHLMSVSGLHVSLLLGFLLILLGTLRTGKLFNTIVCTVFLLFLIPFMNFSTSAIRAVIMNLVLLWSFFVKKDADSLSSLSFAAIILLIFRPFSLKDLSFVLSFTATAGLILLSPVIENLFLKFTKHRFSSLSAMLSVHIFILPLNMYYFGGFTPVSIPANLIFVPMFPIILILLVVSMALGSFIPGTFILLNKITEVYLGAIETVSRLPFENYEISIADFSVIWLFITLALSFVFKSKMRLMFLVVSFIILSNLIFL